jgi:hypothetical protein
MATADHSTAGKNVETFLDTNCSSGIIGTLVQDNHLGNFISQLYESNSLENMTPVQCFSYSITNRERRIVSAVYLLDCMTMDPDLNVNLLHYAILAFVHCDMELIKQICISHPNILKENSDNCARLLFGHLAKSTYARLEMETIFIDYFDVDTYSNISEKTISLLASTDSIRIIDQLISDDRIKPYDLILALYQNVLLNSQIRLANAEIESPNLIKYFIDRLEQLDDDSVVVVIMVCINTNTWSDNFYKIFEGEDDFQDGFIDDVFRMSIEHHDNSKRYVFFKKMLEKYVDYDVSCIFTDDFCLQPKAREAFWLCLETFGQNLKLKDNMFGFIFQMFDEIDINVAFDYLKKFSEIHSIPKHLYSNLITFSGFFREKSSLEQFDFVLERSDDLNKILLELILSHAKFYQDKIALFVKQGADPNAFEGFILLKAVQKGMLGILQELIINGGNISLIKSYALNADFGSEIDLEKYFSVQITEPNLFKKTLYNCEAKVINIIRTLLIKIIDHIEETSAIPDHAFYRDAIKEFYPENFDCDIVIGNGCDINNVSYDLFHIASQAEFYSRVSETYNLVSENEVSTKPGEFSTESSVTQLVDTTKIYSKSVAAVLTKVPHVRSNNVYEKYVTDVIIKAHITMNLTSVASLYNRFQAVSFSRGSDLVAIFKSCIENNFGELFLLICGRCSLDNADLDEIVEWCKEISYLPHVKLYEDFIPELKRVPCVENLLNHREKKPIKNYKQTQVAISIFVKQKFYPEC